MVGDFLAGTPAAGVAAQLADLSAGADDVATGDTARVAVAGVSPRRAGVMRPRVVLDYVDDSGNDRTASASVRLPRDGGTRQATAHLRGCAGGCLLSTITLARSPGDSTLPWTLTSLDFGGVDALAGGWRAASRTRTAAPAGR